MIAVEEEDVSDEENGGTPAPIKRSPNAKMRRAYDDLDVTVYKRKRDRRHRRQRFVRTLRKLAGLCASCGGALATDDGVTCARCLAVDKAYKGTSKEIEGTAVYVDEHARAMRLLFTPRMLPVIGPRYDGSSVPWSSCANLSECMTELIRACGAKDAPGASCPKNCGHFSRAPIKAQ